MERADQVLAERMIDADLAANGAVHLSQQRGWPVRQRAAAPARRGRKSRGIADHAAADGDDRTAAIGARPDEGLVNARDGLEVFEALAVGNQDWLAAASDLVQARAVQSPDNRTRDDESPLPDT